MNQETPENNTWNEHPDRRNDPEFVDEIRKNFARLLLDRATDPERTGPADVGLAAMAEDIANGGKIQRRSAALEIFRGVFYSDDGGMQKYRLSGFEIDYLEKNFFE